MYSVFVAIHRSPWLLQISWWQWLCVLLGAGLSGVVLFTPIWPAVRHQAARSAAIVMVVIVTLHLLLAVGFMLYFFHVPAAAAAGPHNSTEVAPPAAGDSNNTLEVQQQQQAAEQKASVQLQEAEPTGVKKEEDVKRSTEEDKPEAKKISETPLAGSEQEAKQDTSKKEDIVEENHDNKSEKQPIASET